MSVTALSNLLQQNDYSMTMMPDGSGVLMDLRHETLLTFNGSAALMLSCIQEGETEAAMVNRVVQKFAIDEETAATDVSRFVEELAEAVGLNESA